MPVIEGVRISKQKHPLAFLFTEDLLLVMAMRKDVIKCTFIFNSSGTCPGVFVVTVICSGNPAKKHWFSPSSRTIYVP
jgi:hypothetical protein